MRDDPVVMKTITVPVSVDTAIREAAKERGVTQSKFIRDAVAEAIRKEPKG
jgi:hypothetical protein